MASMNPGIILGVQQPDFVNTLARSTAAAGMANQNRRQNALEQVYQQHGQGIAQGDQNALNALAQYDPQAALGMKQTHQSVQFDQEKMRMLRDKAKLDAQMQAAKLSAAERQQAADNLKGVLRGAAALYQQGDRAGFQAWIQQNGLDPSQYTFDQFPAHLASATGTIEALTEAQEYLQGPEPADEYGRYAAEERKAGREPLSRIEYHRAKQKTQQIEVGADGSVKLTEGYGNQGGEVTNTIKTEAQRMETAYESIMQGLDAYDEIVSGGGGAMLPGKQKDALMSARRDLQLQMKELFNLGVLNGPDLELMDQMIVDATDPVNIGLDATGISSLDERTRASTQQLRSQLTRMIEPKMRQAGLAPAKDGAEGEAGEITFENDEQRAVFEKYSQP